jgi:aminobenzoyl-glutamate transport protein
MLPYSVAFTLGGLALLLGWIALDLPLGPGVDVFMPAAAAPPNG